MTLTDSAMTLALCLPDTWVKLGAKMGTADWRLPARKAPNSGRYRPTGSHSAKVP